MKIAHYASLSSLVLLLVAGVQVGALFHGWQQLDQAEQAQHQHERLQQRLTDTLQGTLRDYLSSGDPLRLAEAQTVRQLALGQLAQQDEQLTAPLRALLEKMESVSMAIIWRRASSLATASGCCKMPRTN